MRAFNAAGFRVIGFDVDQGKIDALHRGENYLKHLGADYVKQMVASGRFDATADFSRLGEPDAVISCVPTPLGPHLEPDLSYVERTADDISKTLPTGQELRRHCGRGSWSASNRRRIRARRARSCCRGLKPKA